MNFLRDERGVALVTVILVGAAMTAVVSTASFVTIQEFQAGSQSRRATAALSYAEAGVDRMMQYIRDKTIRGQQRVAGCSDLLTTSGLRSRSLGAPSESFGDGSFKVSATVYDPNATTLENRVPVSPFGPTSPACAAALDTSAYANLYLLITSTGTAPDATRVVRQVVKSRQGGYPVGVYGSSIEITGSPQTVGASLFSDTNIVGREQLSFTGCDPFFKLSDLWPAATGFPPGGLTECPGSHAPSAAHAAQTIYMKANGTVPEFTAAAPNCSANGSGSSQSLWDSDGLNGRAFVPSTSGCSPWSSTPGTSLFSSRARANVGVPNPGLTEDDYQTYAAAARASGIYCTIGTSTTCKRQGADYPNQAVWQDADIAPIFTSGKRNFVAFFDYTEAGTPATNTLSWKADVASSPAPGPVCSSDPAVNRSVVIIARNAGMNLEGNLRVNGALIMDGDFRYTGNPVIDGTIISKGTVKLSGTATLTLDDCWANNQNFGGTTQPLDWSQVDR